MQHTHPAPAPLPRFDAVGQLEKLYRDIGISAVSAALQAMRAGEPERVAGRNPLELPPLLRELGFAA